MYTKIFLSFLFGCLMFLSGCLNNLGGSTETTNRIIGTLYLPDGKTPAAGVEVVIRPKKTIADPASPNTLLADTAVVSTDKDGRFAFGAAIDTGTYVIEAARGNDMVLIDLVAVTCRDSTNFLPPDTLRPAGAVKGIIKLPEGGDSRKVFILAFGLDRFSLPDSDGRFTFTKLARGKYDFRILPALPDYGVRDTAGILVHSGDTTELDTIILPFTGIPTPKNLLASYDTISQKVTLTWSVADVDFVKGFNVLRRRGVFGQYSMVNNSLIIDTQFIDGPANGIEKGAVYQYYVVAVDTNNNSGKNSNSIKIETSYFVNAGNDTTFLAGYPVKLTGVINANLVKPEMYYWDVNGDGTNESATSTANVITWTYPARGIYNAVFSVKDSSGRLYSDTSIITVVPADTSGYPSGPRNLTAQLDTLKQIVKLSWSKPLTGRPILWYAVYRKHKDSVITKIRSDWKDTTYSDSSARLDQTYEYRIAGVDLTETEGQKSDAVKLTITGAICWVKDYPAPSLDSVGAQLKMVRKLGRDRYAGISENSVYILDSNFQVIRKWGGRDLFGHVMDVAVDKNCCLYVVDLHLHIRKFDTLGKVLRNWNDSLPSMFSWTQHIALDSLCRIYISDFPYAEQDNYQSRVRIFDTNMTLLRAIGSNGAGAGQYDYVDEMETGDNNTICIGDRNTGKLLRFDSQGNFMDNVAVHGNFVTGAFISLAKEIVASNDYGFGFFNRNGDIIANANFVDIPAPVPRSSYMNAVLGVFNNRVYVRIQNMIKVYEYSDALKKALGLQ